MQARGAPNRAHNAAARNPSFPHCCKRAWGPGGGLQPGTLSMHAAAGARLLLPASRLAALRALAAARRGAAPMATPAAASASEAAGAAARPKVLVLTGPTAVGKTRASLALAEALDGEVISADSVQVYRRLDIGSDKVRRGPGRRRARRAWPAGAGLAAPGRRSAGGGAACPAQRNCQHRYRHGGTPQASPCPPPKHTPLPAAVPPCHLPPDPARGAARHPAPPHRRAGAGCRVLGRRLLRPGARRRRRHPAGAAGGPPRSGRLLLHPAAALPATVLLCIA